MEKHGRLSEKGQMGKGNEVIVVFFGAAAGAGQPRSRFSQYPIHHPLTEPKMTHAFGVFNRKLQFSVVIDFLTFRGKSNSQPRELPPPSHS